MSEHLTFDACDEYMFSRTGKYDYRAIRYRAACEILFAQGLSNDDTVTDIGAGWTEFDYCLRKEYDWRGRYIPIDAGIDGTDLNNWTPKRFTSFYVALEIIEHLHNPEAALSKMIETSGKGVVVSVPNPRTVDVLGIDDTHFSVVTQGMLKNAGFTVEERLFYGGVFSDGEPDALFAWR